MDKSPFIKVRSILRKPGNPIADTSMRCDQVISVSKADEEMIKIGAGCCMETHVGVIYVEESYEEVMRLIEIAEKAAV